MEKDLNADQKLLIKKLGTKTTKEFLEKNQIKVNHNTR